MKFHDLGPLWVESAGLPLSLSGRRMETVVTALLIRAGEPARADWLIDCIWGPEPPPKASLAAFTTGLPGGVPMFLAVTIVTFIILGSVLEGIPAIAPAELAPPNDRTHLLATVGAKGARAEIREWLVSRGWVEGRDFTCLA